jgi:hypothetical protein
MRPARSVTRWAFERDPPSGAGGHGAETPRQGTSNCAADGETGTALARPPRREPSKVG